MSKLPVKDISPDPVKIHEPELVNLYEKREKIHARAISGFFQNIRHITIWATLALFVLLPWITWDGRQALLFDLPSRKFYIFWWTFLPQDFFFLSWLLIIAAFALFAVTVFAGRVWCGYSCPQTVWTTIFMWIEELTEGNRNARIRLDKSPLSFNKFLRRTLKHTGWVIVALITGLTFVGYFTPVRELYSSLLQLHLGFWEVFWVAFFTAATYMNAGWLREQVCMYMCPYGRFQSVMFDRDTLIISYDEKRGEPRGGRKRNADPAELNLGSCIDCELCVQVCPVGIDIRDGLQFECIQCAACVDACDSVMDQMNYPRGLVKYTTENSLENGKKPKFVRGRLIGYSLALAIMSGLFIGVLANRVPLSVEAIRDRNQLYRESSQGLIENAYLIKVMNKSQVAEQYELKIITDAPIKLEKSPKLNLEAGEFASVPVTLVADPKDLTTDKYQVTFEVRSLQNEDVVESIEGRFFAPKPR